MRGIPKLSEMESDEMEHIAITTRFMGPTNTLGARIVATTSNGHKLTRPFDYANRNPHAIVAAELARTLGWTGTIVCGAIPGGYAFTYSASSRFDIADGAPNYE